jgi:protein-disulfide isomerase
MARSVTLGGWTPARWASGVLGAGMMAVSALTMRVYYGASYPAAVAPGTWCGEGVLGCDAAVLSAAGSVAGVPIGWGGFLLGGTLLLGALLPSAMLERTNRALLAVNAVAVTGLFFYATLALRTLCVLCLAYGALALAAAWLFLRAREEEAPLGFLPSPMHVAVLALVLVTGGWGFAQYGDAVRSTEDTVAGMRAVGHFYSLPQVPWPSEISPYRTMSATDDFEGAAIRIVEFADPLCIDCLVLHEQLKQMETEFAGQINLAWQFFPLEAICNDVVEKDKHPGSCDLSYMAAYDPSRFRTIHDEILANQDAARDRGWQLELARRHGVEAALTDTAVQARVQRLIRTGTEYERTSERFAHGIRSTPTMIINNRMVIGTLPTDQLRAIFRALVDEHNGGHARFMENWLEPGCVIGTGDSPPKPCGS